MEETHSKIQLLDPTTGPVARRNRLSPRLDTFTGKTLGIIWNNSRPGDLMLNRMIDVLREKYDIKHVVFRTKPYVGNVAPKEIFDELSATCDAVITGIGD